MPPVPGVASDVTVVIPAWGVHAERHLGAALESVLTQDPRPDVVVVDNANPTPLVVRGAGIVRLEDRLTVGASRNAGFDAVTSRYVMFWDADDVMLPGTIRALLEVTDQPDVVAGVARILEEDLSEHGWPRPYLNGLARRPRLWAGAHAVSAMFPTIGAVLIRSDVLRDAGGVPDLDCGDDWALGVSLAVRGRIAFTPHAGRIYRAHPDALSIGWTAAQHAANARAVRAHIASDRAAAWLHRLDAAVVVGQVLVAAARPLRRRLRPRLRDRARANGVAVGSARRAA